MEKLIQELEPGRRNDYAARVFDDVARGTRIVCVAAIGGKDAGYCVLNLTPKYAYFRAHDIPEIQDLNVLPPYRRRGVASALIAHCENLARRKGHRQMGIAVGLHGGFGAAQRLYVRLGYVPDGYGITHDRAIVPAGSFKPVDDHLCLMMVKGIGR